MKRKRIAILVLGVSILSASTAFAFVETKKDKVIEVNKVSSKIGEPYDMGYYMRNNDFEAMDDFMNNLTDKDYSDMIDIMRDNGYEYMAEHMESVDKDYMIDMHNSMMGGY